MSTSPSIGFEVLSPEESGLAFGSNPGIRSAVHLLVTCLIGLIVRANSLPEKGLAPGVRAFGALFLARYALVVLFALIFVVVGVNPQMRFVNAFLLFLLINIVPVVWLKFYFEPYAMRMTEILGSDSFFEIVFTRHNISKREQEIARLILDGKTNKEIEEILFISYHTVKNHVYNLYRKLGVKNRHQFVHFFIATQAGRVK